MKLKQKLKKALKLQNIQIVANKVHNKDLCSYYKTTSLQLKPT